MEAPLILLLEWKLLRQHRSLAKRGERIAPFHVMALLAHAQRLEMAGRDIIHLEVGEPDFPCPQAVLKAGAQALAAGQTRYTPAEGLLELREKLVVDYRQRFGVTVSPDNILLTPGASGAIQLALAALVDVGQGVLLSDPGYPCNRHFVELVNGEVQPLVLDAAAGFRVTPQAVDAAWQPNTVAALLASPDNPTGQVYGRDELAALAQVVEAKGGWLLMDEIYQGICADEARLSVLSVAPEALVINSFSKYFGMTGWRLGWLVAPAPLVPLLQRLAQNFFLAPSTPAQYAALALFTAPVQEELLARRDELARRQQFCLAELARLGLPVVGRPAGAFYLYIDVSALTADSFAFCETLLEATGVALTPGLDFGEGHAPERYLRLACTAPIERLGEAFARLERFLKAGA